MKVEVNYEEFMELVERERVVASEKGELVEVGRDLPAKRGTRVSLKPELRSQGDGTITEVNEEGTCVVTWDNGNVHSCRVGLFQEFWLLALPD
mmetsp:Transcript_10419/g.34771  ORF Transcript_10419/g.34771 Transcript_10419/m.34771 type:complete len:93 (-) Transcript_10419:550-828(-)